jgi:hypothetical protein
VRTVNSTHVRWHSFAPVEARQSSGDGWADCVANRVLSLAVTSRNHQSFAQHQAVHSTRGILLGNNSLRQPRRCAARAVEISSGVHANVVRNSHSGTHSMPLHSWPVCWRAVVRPHASRCARVASITPERMLAPFALNRQPRGIGSGEEKNVYASAHYTQTGLLLENSRCDKSSTRWI